MNNGWPVVIVIALFVLSLVVAMLPPVRRTLIGEDEPRDLRNLGREHLPPLRFGEVEVRIFELKEGPGQTSWTAIFYRDHVRFKTVNLKPTYPHLFNVGRAKEWVRSFVPELTVPDEIVPVEERIAQT